MKVLYSTILIGCLISSTLADGVDFWKCSDEDSKQCDVSEVRMTPCTNPARCVFKRGQSVEFSFDFTPEFALESASNKAYAKINDEYIDWIGELEENACGAVQCPVTSNTKNNYTKAIKLSKSTQAGKFTVKWKLFNEDASRSCCFELNVQVKK